ncbi:MAG: threonine--tRNA ligase [Patescibacteria group bacterium]
MDITTQRHSAAHIMAAAIQRLYPQAKFGVGPAIDNGFYYDIDIDRALNQEDVDAISKEMKKIVSEKLPFIRREMSIDAAMSFFDEHGQTYKFELLKDLKEKGTTSLSAEEQKDAESVDTVSMYTTGEFVDLCRGPHVETSDQIGAVKLTKFSGAYWRGKQENPQMQRIYGLVFPTQKELDEYLAMMEEAERRDHRKIGPELGLFMFHEWAPGIPFFLPNGMIIQEELVKFVREQSYGEGYKEIRTPQIFDAELWKTSGHWEHYQNDLFKITIDEREMAVKPMNCPGHMLVFREGLHSYRELPLRLAETTTLHRYELSGALGGLTRCRGFGQDDTHIFLRPNQVRDEVHSLLSRIKTIYEIFKLQITDVMLSTRPESFLGTKEVWDTAESDLKEALTAADLPFHINEGDGAFYGPKIDIQVSDAIGRKWQLATIQLDYQMPQKFKLEYVEEDGSRQCPVVIHRAILGSFERFFGILIEHYIGAFPTWLSPVQVRVIPVADRHNDAAQALRKELMTAGMRADVDDNTESVGKKIRSAEKAKIPYALVIGDREAEGGDLTVRIRGVKDQEVMSKAAFVERVMGEIRERK